MNLKEKVFYLILLCLFFGFFFWYHNTEGKLTSEEIDHYMKVLSDAPKKKTPENVSSFKNLRRFAEADDGQSFYMVNMMRYYKEAQYPDGRTLSGSEAKKLYGRSVLPLLLSRAGHPVIILNPNLILHSDNQNSTQWDEIAIVRYRSRRDLLEMITSKNFNQAVIHKWASLETTTITPSQGIWFPWIHGVIAVILLLIGLIGRVYFYLKTLPTST